MNMVKTSRQSLNISMWSRNEKMPPIPHTKRKRTYANCIINLIIKSRSIYVFPMVIFLYNTYCCGQEIPWHFPHWFSIDIKKNVQELYALINYGEMRKRVTFPNQKCFMKLRELVYKGWVSLRWKGKTYRIKTPSCKALRKINQVEGECLVMNNLVLNPIESLFILWYSLISFPRMAGGHQTPVESWCNSATGQ